MISLAGVTDVLLQILMIVLGILFFGGLAAGTIWLYLTQKRYKQFKCIIWTKDAFGQVIEKTDGGGIFIDKKTNNKRFFMKNSKVGLEPDNIPYIQSGKTKVVYMRQDGLKNFRFIKPVLGPQLSFEVGEEDVNWAINSYERGKRIFSTDRLLQFMPFILLAFVSIIILIIFIYLFRKLDALVDFAQAAEEMTRNMAQAQAGTVIIE